jgi:seryl-tRNA synthetase
LHPTHTGLLNHHDLLWRIGGYEPDRGSAVAGHRGYFLRDVGVLLNQVPPATLANCSPAGHTTPHRCSHTDSCAYHTAPHVLPQAFINYGIAFLRKRGYVPLQPPFLMNKDVMAGVAQLEQFDEELYKVRVGVDGVA